MYVQNERIASSTIIVGGIHKKAGDLQAVGAFPAQLLDLPGRPLLCRVVNRGAPFGLESGPAEFGELTQHADQLKGDDRGVGT